MATKTGKSFNGFIGNPEVTPIPNQFFTTAIQNIQDIDELKVILHIFWLLSRRRGHPRIVTSRELVSDKILMNGILTKHDKLDETVKQALTSAVKHRILLRLSVHKDDSYEDVYLINSEQEREFVAKIKSGEMKLSGFTFEEKEIGVSLQQPNIFGLYEENIGLLTPMIVEELKEAEKLYPSDWIKSAFKEAVRMNKRSWKYILRILERWNIEGKDDGKIGRYSKEENDPAKYIRGKYGHMVKR